MNTPDKMSGPGQDLSHFHEPVSPWFPVLETCPPDAFRLENDQIRFFHENGFLGGLDILDAAQIGLLLGELDEFLVPGHPGHQWWYEYHRNESADPERVLFHALGAWRLRPAFHDLLWHPAITVPASQLLAGPVRFWHDQLFCKPARHGGSVAWHQDYSYWTRTRPMQHLTIWIGLDDATVDNGCLQYIPGSHLWDLLPATGLAGDMDAIRATLSETQWNQMQHAVPIQLKAGQCAIHHPLMVHGSTHNSTDRPRRAVVVNLVRDGVCSESDEPLLSGVPSIPAGQPLQGRFFPLLHPGNRGGSEC